MMDHHDLKVVKHSGLSAGREKEIRDWVRLRYGGDCTKVFDATVELLSEIDSLRESIRIYGGHCGTCRVLHNGNTCGCGFREVYIKATKEEHARAENYLHPPSEPRGIRGGK